MRIQPVFCFLIVIFSFIHSPATAQFQARVSAQIIDAETALPLPSGAVLVFEISGETPVAAGGADTNGRVVVTGLSAGEYLLTFNADGYKSVDRTMLISERNDVYRLGTISLNPFAGASATDNTQQDEIVVMGQARRDIDIRPGVNSFSIEDNVVAQSGSTLNAMKGLPGVTVDQEGRVLLRGSDRVIILVNGKPSALTGIGDQSGLESLPAANIERIEIINNPSARYGAAGGAGVINIILKDGAGDGWSGDIGLKGGLGVLSKARADLPTQLGSFSNNPKITPSFNLNYGGDRTDYFLQGEVLIQDSLPNNEFTTRFFDTGQTIESQVPENREQTHYIFKAGVDREIGSGHQLSFATVFDYETHIDRAQVPFFDADTGQRLRFWFWREEEVTGHFSISGDYTHAFADPGHELSFRAEYIRGWEDEAYFLNEVSPIRVGDDMTHLIATEHTVPITLDYTRPYSNGRLELGGKVQLRWIPITYDVVRGVQSVIFPGLGDNSRWEENIYSVYGNLVRESSRFVIEGGLRAEQTEVRYELPEDNIYYPRSDAYEYFRLFPNVRLTYKLGEATDVSAFFNIRVDRPGEPELRIFPKYDDPELLKVGDPYLRPQFTKTYELALQHSWGRANVSAAFYYRDIEDSFQRIFAADPTAVNFPIVNKIFQNTGNATNAGVELIGAFKAGSRLSFSGSVNIYHIDIEPATLTLLFPVERQFDLAGSSDTTWDGKITVELELPGGVELQATGVYYADRNIPQGRELARSSVDIGLSKLFFEDHLEFTLAATDIFNDFGLEQELQGDGFTAIYQNFYETQIVTAGLKYKF